MPIAIIDRQRRVAERGRIRLGEKRVSSRGKEYPAKLETFRLTSQDEQSIVQAAAVWGGVAEPWPDAPGGAQQWQVTTQATVLPVIVPPGGMAFSQFFEVWSRAGCLKRCDGLWDVIRDVACDCDDDNRECTLHTRLSVMLPDLPGWGLWRLDAGGWNAAYELNGAVAIIERAGASGTLLPAKLRLEQRQVIRKDAKGQPETRRFPVPVLDVDVPLRQMLGAGGFRGSPALDIGTPELDADVPVTAIVDDVPLTPIPPDDQAVPGVAEQLDSVNAANLHAEGERRANREGGAEPIKRSQRPPRTAAERALPPLLDTRPLTATQHKKFHATLGEAAIGEPQRHALIHLLTAGRTVSTSELQRHDYDRVLLVAEMLRDRLVALVVDGPDGAPIVLKGDGEPANVTAASVEVMRRWAEGERSRRAEQPTLDGGDAV